MTSPHWIEQDSLEDTALAAPAPALREPSLLERLESMPWVELGLTLMGVAAAIGLLLLLLPISGPPPFS